MTMHKRIRLTPLDREENWGKIHHGPFCLLEYVKKAGLEEFWRMNEALRRENTGTKI
jgi:hypothetical protein